MNAPKQLQLKETPNKIREIEKEKKMIVDRNW